jgi:hypothetical protein
MPMNTFPDIGELTDEQKPLVADGKSYYFATAKANAFETRYGKKILCMATREDYPDGNPKEVTLRVQSAKNNKYVIIEYFKEDGNADYTLLCYTKNFSNIETRFSRHLDAEVTLADLIAEE